MSKSKKGVRNFAPKKSVTEKQAKDMSLVSVVTDSAIVSVAVNSVNTHKYSHPTGHGQVAEDFFAAKNGGEVIYSEGRNFKNAADVIVNGEEFQVKCHATASSANRAIRDSEGNVRYADDMGIVVPTEQVEFLSNRGVNVVDLGASYTDIKQMSTEVLTTITANTMVENLGTIAGVSSVSSVAKLMNSEVFYDASSTDKCIMVVKELLVSTTISGLVTSALIAFSNIESAVNKIDILSAVSPYSYLASLGALSIEAFTVMDSSSFMEKLSIVFRGIVLLVCGSFGVPIAGSIISNVLKAIFGWFKFNKGESYVQC